MQVEPLTEKEEEEFKRLGRWDLLTPRPQTGQADFENYDIPNISGKQVGGSHYKEHKVQPWDIIDEYKLDFYEGNVLKYLLRKKGGRKEDLEKALHYLEKILGDLEND